MERITQRQRMVLDFIVRHSNVFGYPPTLREIGRHMGIRSTNGVNDHLMALERKGYIRRDMGALSRAIELVRNSDGQRIHVVVVTSTDLSILAEHRAEEAVG